MSFSTKQKGQWKSRGLNDDLNISILDQNVMYSSYSLLSDKKNKDPNSINVIDQIHKGQLNIDSDSLQDSSEHSEQSAPDSDQTFSINPKVKYKRQISLVSKKTTSEMLLEKKMQNFDSKYYQQIFEPIEKDKPFDYKLETGNTQKKKHDSGHDQKTPKSENKG